MRLPPGVLAKHAAHGGGEIHCAWVYQAQAAAPLHKKAR